MKLKSKQQAHVEAYEEAHVDLSNLELKILSILEGKPVNIQELLSGCGYSTRTGNFKISLTLLKDTGLLEMTIPDKPRSRKQKYRITEKGKRIFNKKKLKNE